MTMEGLRPATDGDVAAITALINLAFQKESFFKKGDRTDEGQVRGKMKSGSFFVVDGECALAGCIYVEMADASNPKVIAAGAGAGYIGMLAVDPSQQGRGLGKRLMRFAEDELRRRGATRVQLRIVNLRTELVEFYGKLGYRATGTTPYPEPNQLSQPVHFVNMEKVL